ncbi:MAG: hypothetical protein COB49_06550 [Alphaproteobacteria bacterium]|nr:MAG: hypothetical protein COB49_06550 [Alphaproteobacteria bacterium]
MAENSGKMKWINVVLFLSLALNFFIAGYGLSDIRVFKNMYVKKVFHKRPEIRIVDYFPRAEKRLFRRRIYDQHEKLKPDEIDIFEGQKEIFRVISEKEVNEMDLRQAFRKYQITNDQLQTIFNDIVVTIILEMDHKTRMTIIKRGKKAHLHRQKMREKWQNNRVHSGGNGG